MPLFLNEFVAGLAGMRFALSLGMNTKRYELKMTTPSGFIMTVAAFDTMREARLGFDAQQRMHPTWKLSLTAYLL